MTYQLKKTKGSPLVWSVLLGVLTLLVTMAVAAILVSQGVFSEGSMGYLGSASLFCTASIGALPLASKSKKKLLAAMFYGLGWAIALLILRMICWNQAETFNCWPFFALLCGAVVAGVISSRPKKLAY